MLIITAHSRREGGGEEKEEEEEEEEEEETRLPCVLSHACILFWKGEWAGIMHQLALTACFTRLF